MTRGSGHRLTWAEQGDPQGRPVLCLHGSPGSRLSRHPHPGELREAGIRQITYDRPGYGGSDPLPGRSVADAVQDVAAVLDAAGVERAAVLGGSGGGPHALALAALLPERCTVVHCRVGLAPYDAPGLDFYAGMDPANQRRFRAAAESRAAALGVLGPDLEAMRADIARDPARAMGPMAIPESDRAVLRRLGVQLAESVAEAARQGAVGVADDFVALTRPWGFDPRTVTAPVVLSYGLDDVNVPPGHGRWLEQNVPHREVRVGTEGHLATPEAMLELLRELA